ncbi:MAG: MaoC family dehydratase [Chloroflexi bacterium]|nr:MaoC family dehydratase [Chloroflexota bacterium]
MAGRYYEDLSEGVIIRHELGRTITEADNVFFNSITMNPQPLHINEDFAANKTEFGRRVVNGILTLGLAVGLTIPELTQGTIIANLGYEQVNHPHPMFHGDTLYVETEVLSKRESQSRPEAGLVALKHVGRNQDGVVVIEFSRTVLILKRPNASG